MSDELWANPKAVLASIDALRWLDDSYAPFVEPVPKPDLGSVLASAVLIALANVLNELPGVVRREVGRFADVVTTGMIDVVDADQIVGPPGDAADRQQRDMAAFWAAHGDVVSSPGNTNGEGLGSPDDGYDDVGDDFEGALRDEDAD